MVKTYSFDNLVHPKDASYKIVAPQAPPIFTDASSNPDGVKKSQSFLKLESKPIHPYVEPYIAPPSVLSSIVGAIQ